MLGDNATLDFSRAAVNRGGTTIDVFGHGGHTFGGSRCITRIVWRQSLALPGYRTLSGRFDQQLGTALAELGARDLNKR